MRPSLPLLIGLLCGCASPPPPLPSAAPIARPQHSRAIEPAAAARAHDDVSALTEPPAPVAPQAEQDAVAAEDAATPAGFGQPLRPGLYLFPDGLRIRVEQIAGCDFDTSAPCFGGTYRAQGTFGKQEATTQWSTRSARVLGHRIDVTQSDFTVRR